MENDQQTQQNIMDLYKGLTNGKKNDMLKNIKLFLECQLLSAQFNEILNKKGIGIMVHDNLQPPGLLMFKLPSEYAPAVPPSVVLPAQAVVDVDSIEPPAQAVAPIEAEVQ